MTRAEDIALTVTDPHVHIWDLGTRLYPRRERRRAEGDASVGDYLVADLLVDAGPIRIAKAVHIEAFPTDGLAEARHVHAIAEREPSGIPHGIVANADLADPQLDAALSALKALPRVRGIRHALNRSDETRDLLGEKAWRAGFGALARHGLSFELQVSPDRMPEAADLIAANPGVAVALNHTGWPRKRGFAGWRAWRDGLRLLARLPNVWVKISGFGMFDREWTPEAIRPYAFEALDAFGVERAMFASNFPVDRAFSDYPRLWRAFAALVAELPADHRQRLLRHNAEAFYRI